MFHYRSNSCQVTLKEKAFLKDTRLENSARHLPRKSDGLEHRLTCLRMPSFHHRLFSSEKVVEAMKQKFRIINQRGNKNYE